MKSSNLELIPRTVHELGTSATIVGTRQKGVGYYGGQGNSQQIRFQCNDFPGQVIVQASLDTDPKTADPLNDQINKALCMYMHRPTLVLLIGSC